MGQVAVGAATRRNGKLGATFKKLPGAYLLGTAIFVVGWFIINPFFGAIGAGDAANWRKLLAWDRKAADAGECHRVFCASLAHAFDNQATQEWRERLWDLIAQTSHLDWLLLTKRPQKIIRMLPSAFDFPEWGDGWPNVSLGISAEDKSATIIAGRSLTASPPQ